MKINIGDADINQWTITLKYISSVLAINENNNDARLMCRLHIDGFDDVYKSFKEYTNAIGEKDVMEVMRITLKQMTLIDGEQVNTLKGD